MLLLNDSNLLIELLCVKARQTRCGDTLLPSKFRDLLFLILTLLEFLD
jgi:hypothetical protein